MIPVGLSLPIFTPGFQYKAAAINVEVPVRVFKGNTFIDNLTIEDFEILEDGKPQALEAMYLIKEAYIEREETTESVKQKKKAFVPETSRMFILQFQVYEYLPKIREALAHFFKKVIKPGDSVLVVTPVKTYSLNSRALESSPKEKIVEGLVSKLKKDIRMGNSEYNSLVNKIFTSQKRLSGAERNTYIDNFFYLRNLDQKKLREFAEYLKNLVGQKYVFLFYQKEIIPIRKGGSGAAALQLMRAPSVNVKKIKQYYSDSLVSLYFLYITKTKDYESDVEQRRPPGQESFDVSMDYFNVFNQVAEATGGLTDTSSNIAASFERSVAASESYYLLYYSPRDYKADGKFREIEVKIKNQNYKIAHRMGYVAD